MKKTTFGVLVYSIFSITGIIYACRCIQAPTPIEEYNRSGAVFSGVVRKIEKIEGVNKVYFDLLHSWKGNLSSKIVVWTNSTGTACGYRFETNTAYLVYSYSVDSIATSSCTRTRHLAYADEDLEFLNTLPQPSSLPVILYQNYPNPFNSSTEISYYVNIPGNVVVELYDYLGQKKMDLVNEFKGQGYYTIKVPNANLSSGIYFYQLITDAFKTTKKMILLK